MARLIRSDKPIIRKLYQPTTIKYKWGFRVSLLLNIALLIALMSLSV